jgi:hypothetical protein
MTWHLQISMHNWTAMAVRSMRLLAFFGSSFTFLKPHKKKVMWSTVRTKSWSKALTVMMFGILVWDYVMARYCAKKIHHIRKVRLGSVLLKSLGTYSQAEITVFLKKKGSIKPLTRHLLQLFPHPFLFHGTMLYCPKLYSLHVHVSYK